MARRSGLGRVTRAFHRPDTGAWKSGTCPRIEPDLETGIRSVHETRTASDYRTRYPRPRNQDNDGPQHQDHRHARDENQHGERDHDNAGSGNENNGG